MPASIESQREALERKKTALKRKEQLLKLREERRRAKQCTKIGKLAMKVGIDHLDEDELLGAFVEILDQSKNETFRAQWRERASKKSLKGTGSDCPTYAIVFDTSPSTELKSELKTLNATWNRFKKEYYVTATRDEITRRLGSGDHYQLEEIR